MCLGIPGQLVSRVEGYGDQLVLVDVAGAQRRVNLGMLSDEDQAALTPGEWVIVHMGFVVERVDAAAAEKAMSGLEMMGRPRQARSRQSFAVLVDREREDYRPMLHGIASDLGLGCSVTDVATGYVVDVEGDSPGFEAFERLLGEHALTVKALVSPEDSPLEARLGAG